MRIALGLSYRGAAYLGWQSQPSGKAVQDHLEAALRRFVGEGVRTVCAGRTDAAVHALQQVVHFDSPVERAPFSWVRGVNSFLPPDIAVLWAQAVAEDFHAQKSAISRRYRYVLLASAVRPAVLESLVGWTHARLDLERMRAAARILIGRHDFSAFRASQCQARSPVKTLHEIEISCQGNTWNFDFHANAFLHHMVRNIMGCLIAVGSGAQDTEWLQNVLMARLRSLAAPTFMPDGLYFLGPHYPVEFGLPEPARALPVLLA
ncbi:MAG: tRNA pseudouridine(38-40) synthase TruA [Thiomonas sp. 13-66-29]|uniref:tRNA pseudouridine synthase A n=1 Tax=Thiomonas delicata TaxID=364030 RepID=A0A238D4D1_THIDL|nr:MULTISPECIES: tRNA pseudouridine(38-40) synthase TruA [Thiomonas]OZB44743.1 MAG: tRNA pseudouridine(38-40) synthase TruA [Thiomonas sp. 15-66-11]OZB50952.1 MAG: tRNA pseudouridine(38-40) synthase TruA [Thiomonas sp. 14-66-4]OZB63303.1 MAG: tRNA pseudouridine(38-40) synthase TruA [Thiomonas sp. 13-66-29]SBP88168.1 pseudouridylate synthase I [Thiomonas delicata]